MIGNGAGIARAIVEKTAALGGTLTRSDLADYRAEWVEPISTRYHGFDVFELPPNDEGFAVLQAIVFLPDATAGPVATGAVAGTYRAASDHRCDGAAVGW